MSRKKTLRLLTCLFATTLLSGVAATAVACAKTTTSEAPDYSYENSPAYLPEYDSAIKMDGVLDDAAYANLLWLENDYVESNTTITVRSTAYFGEKGVFFLFDVNDPAVYVNEDRSGSWNSGVELYLAGSAVEHIEGKGWEIDFTPGVDQISTRRRRGGLFAEMLTAKEATPFMRSAGKGEGSVAVGGAGATGYTIEAFFPYAFFGDEFGAAEGENVQSLALCPTLLRMYTNEETDRNRLWFDFGYQDRTGYSFSDPRTWWRFDEGGLDAHIVTLNTEGSGTLTGRSYVVEGEKLELTVAPAEGFRIKSVKAGEQDVTNDLFIDEDGAVKVQVEGVSSDVTVTATFEQLPAERFALSGNITYFGEALTEARRAGLRLKAYHYGAVFDATLSAGGGYTVSVPAGEYTLVLTKADGTPVQQIEGTLSADATKDIPITETLDAEIFKGEATLTKKVDDITAGSSAIQGTLYSNGTHGEGNLLSPSVVESTFTISTLGSIENGPRFGMRLYGRASGDTSNQPVVDVVIARQGNVWCLDIGYDLINNAIHPQTNYTLTDEQVQAVQSGTFKVLVVQEGSEYRLYAPKGDHYEFVESYTDTKGRTQVYSIDLITNTNETALERGTGITFGMKDTRLYGNYVAGIDSDDRTLIKALVNAETLLRPEIESPHADVAITSAADALIVGSELKFTVTAHRYAEVTKVLVNGTEVTQQDGAYTHTVTAEDAANGLTIEVQANADATFYAGKGNVSKAFSELEKSNYPDGTSSGGGTYQNAHNVLDPLYSCGDHGNALPAFSVMESSFYFSSIDSVSSNGPRTGIRLYNRVSGQDGNHYLADVIIAREGNVWCLDIGNGIVNEYNNGRPQTTYQLSQSQIDAVEAGTFKIIVIQDGSKYRLYAQDGTAYEFVEEFTDSAGGTSISAIDLVVNSWHVALDRCGSGNFGMNDTNIIAEFTQTYTDTELIKFLYGDETQVSFGYTIEEQYTQTQVTSGGGTDNRIAAGDTVTLTVTPDRFATIVSVEVNGTPVMASAGNTYTYQVPQDLASNLKIVINATAEAVEYAGKGDITKKFSEVTRSTDDSKKDANNVQGPLYSCGDHGNVLPSPSVLESSFYFSSIDSVTDNGPRIGMRLYNRVSGKDSNNYLADVIIARQEGVWCLDIGGGVVNEQVTPDNTVYQLNETQIAAVKAGTFKIVIVQNGSNYSLYAEDGDVYDFVETFEDNANGTSISAIDLVVNSWHVALDRCDPSTGKTGEFGMKGTCVIGGFGAAKTDGELIQMITGKTLQSEG